MTTDRKRRKAEGDVCLHEATQSNEPTPFRDALEMMRRERAAELDANLMRWAESKKMQDEHLRLAFWMGNPRRGLRMLLSSEHLPPLP